MEGPAAKPPPLGEAAVLLRLPPPRLPADWLLGMGPEPAAVAAAAAAACAGPCAPGADCGAALEASTATLPSASCLLLISRPPMAEKTSSSLADFGMAARCCC